MKKMKASEIRQKYLDFFVEKGHMIEPSAPLVPIDDIVDQFWCSYLEKIL